jgi:hypothetical protein
MVFLVSRGSGLHWSWMLKRRCFLDSAWTVNEVVLPCGVEASASGLKALFGHSSVHPSRKLSSHSSHQESVYMPILGSIRKYSCLQRYHRQVRLTSIEPRCQYISDVFLRCQTYLSRAIPL